MEDLLALATAVRRRRSTRGFKTAQELADAATVHLRTIQKIESAESSVSPKTKRLVEESLGWASGTMTDIANGKSAPQGLTEPTGRVAAVRRLISDLEAATKQAQAVLHQLLVDDADSRPRPHHPAALGSAPERPSRGV